MKIFSLKTLTAAALYLGTIGILYGNKSIRVTDKSLKQERLD